MGDEKQFLNGFEEFVLLAVQRLRDNAYGVTIRQAVDEATGRTTSIGAVYTALERLEDKGFVRSYQGDPTPERGGRAKRYFEITGTGVQALADAERARDLLRSRLKPVGGAA
jgi:PadR family transcriptional regulator PadR